MHLGREGRSPPRYPVVAGLFLQWLSIVVFRVEGIMCLQSTELG